MTDTTLKIDKTVRDHLATVAAEQGMSSRALAERVLSELATEEQRAARTAAGLAYVHEHLCPDLTDDDIARADRLREDLLNGGIGEVR